MAEGRSETLLPAVVLALGVVIATIIGGSFFVKGKRGDQTITVTGSARKRIKSDLVVWKAGVSYQAPVLADAYRSLSESVPRGKDYLVGKGIPKTKLRSLRSPRKRCTERRVTAPRLPRSRAIRCGRSCPFVRTTSIRSRRSRARPRS